MPDAPAFITIHSDSSRFAQEERDAVPDAPPTREFQQLMRDAAKTGEVGEMLAVRAEWM